MEKSCSKSRKLLVKLMRLGRYQMEEALQMFEEGQPTGADPQEWSLKEHIAHLAFWEKRVIDTYQLLQAGGEPPYPSSLSDEELDALNAGIGEEFQMKDLAELRVMENQYYSTLVSMASLEPCDDLFNPRRFPWMQGQTLAEWIENNTFRHYQEHGLK